jgi:hypothetical protein
LRCTAALALFCKQEAAAANILSDVRFKLLNVALLTAGLGHILILGPRFNGGPLLPLVRCVFGGILYLAT